ncbi:amphi-Trp domain-containing protein [Streptomyces sp. NPDC093568]|uniref:amphi-Trp domain-containing protein n=1 Tax=Streptomyces sp. NPDC093568 TaxID=3366041 RepID=UPI0037F27B38
MIGGLWRADGLLGEMSDSALGSRMGDIGCLRRIGEAMKDLKLEQKRSLSRTEAADQLEALASALREGGDAELELDPWKLSLRIPADLRSEIEIEVSDGEIELEIEFKWSTTATTPDRTGTGAGAVSGRSRGGTTKRTASKRTAAKRS